MQCFRKYSSDAIRETPLYILGKICLFMFENGCVDITELRYEFFRAVSGDKKEPPVT